MHTVADLNANLGGDFRVGFTNITLNGVPTAGSNSALYTFTSTLIINGDAEQVPEPSSVVLLGAGLVVLLTVVPSISAKHKLKLPNPNPNSRARHPLESLYDEKLSAFGDPAYPLRRA